MRLFGNRQPADDEPQDTDQDPIEGNQDPQGDPEPQPDPVLPADANLDELYDAEGEPLYEIDGQPCDAQGNLIPAKRPEAQTPPEPPTPEKPKKDWQSPFADGILTKEEREAAEELVSPEAMRLIETVAARTADRIVASREQQRAVAREIGIPEEMAPQLAAMEQHVPQNLRGTKQGAIAAALLAVGQEAAETGDLQAALRRLLVEKEEVVTPPPPRPPLPPSARPPAPRGNPEPRRTRTPNTTRLGLTETELAIIQSERKTRKS